MTRDSVQPSRYLDYLPAVYGAGGDLDAVLRAFEHVLTGRRDADEPGLEEILDGIRGDSLAGIHRYYHPGFEWSGGADVELLPEQRAPADFLSWLAGWVALVPRADSAEVVVRRLIARAVELYRLRGTRDGIIELLEIYGVHAVITEWKPPASASGAVPAAAPTTPGSPFYFCVSAKIATPDPDVIAEQEAFVRAIVDAEKPAQTYYEFRPDTTHLQVEVTSHVGVDTLLGLDDNLEQPAP
jgi:Phage tail protein (Tail_P2_I)